MAARIVKLEKAIDEAVRLAPPEIRVVIEALQALRGVAQTTAATIVSELGSLSRFQSPRQLMGYSGLVAREHSSGNRVQRGGITKTGNGHLKGAGGGGMGLSTSPERDRFSSTKAEKPGAQRRSQEDRLEGAAAPAQTLPGICRARQKQKPNRDRAGTRIAGVHLGDCHRRGKAAPTGQGGLRKELDGLLDSSADDSAGPTKRRTLLIFYAERFPNPTRASSPRQLPTDHVTAVPTREYQSDQSSRMLLGCPRPCCPQTMLEPHPREHFAVMVTCQDKRPASLHTEEESRPDSKPRQTRRGLTGSLHIRSRRGCRTGSCAGCRKRR